jgi:hypothetical protein
MLRTHIISAEASYDFVNNQGCCEMRFVSGRVSLDDIQDK